MQWQLGALGGNIPQRDIDGRHGEGHRPAAPGVMHGPEHLAPDLLRPVGVVAHQDGRQFAGQMRVDAGGAVADAVGGRAHRGVVDVAAGRAELAHRDVALVVDGEGHAGHHWQVDHVIPLVCGGCDAVVNMQWLPAAIKTCAASTGVPCKDRWEQKVYCTIPLN